MNLEPPTTANNERPHLPPQRLNPSNHHPWAGLFPQLSRGHVPVSRRGSNRSATREGSIRKGFKKLRIAAIPDYKISSCLNLLPLKTMKTYHAGDLAFYDTFSGCIPCKVLSISGSPGNTSQCRIIFKLTTSRGAYRCGEVLESDALKVIPRPYVKRNRIFGGYTWSQNPKSAHAIA